MTSEDWSSINPYQASAEAPPSTADSSLNGELRAKLNAFRQQIHAIGAAWIFFGLLVIPTASALSVAGQRWRDFEGHVHEENVAILIAANAIGILGLAWIVAGIATCLKNLWAAYMGLTINYVALAGLVLTLPQAVFNIVFVLLFVFVLLQAHRVLRWAKELSAAGIPLNAKP